MWLRGLVTRIAQQQRSQTLHSKWCLRQPPLCHIQNCGNIKLLPSHCSLLKCEATRTPQSATTNKSQNKALCDKVRHVSPNSNKHDNLSICFFHLITKVNNQTIDTLQTRPVPLDLLLLAARIAPMSHVDTIRPPHLEAGFGHPPQVQPTLGSGVLDRGPAMDEHWWRFRPTGYVSWRAGAMYI